MDKMLKKLKKHLNSPEGKIRAEGYVKRLVEKKRLNDGRFKRFEEWLENNDFDKLMCRLILEHGEEWRENCWSKGCEVHMNNKLSFIFEYILQNNTPIKVSKLETDFPNQIWFFKGYYFQLTHGQGSIVDVYNGKDFKHLLGT